MQQHVWKRRSTLTVDFDGGGCVRFVSSSQEMDGLMPFQVEMDDTLREKGS